MHAWVHRGGLIPRYWETSGAYTLIATRLSRQQARQRRRISRRRACFMFDDDGYVSMNSVHGLYSGILNLAHLRRHRWSGGSDKQLPVGHRKTENADVGDQGTALSYDHVDRRENLHVSMRIRGVRINVFRNRHFEVISWRLLQQIRLLIHR